MASAKSPAKGRTRRRIYSERELYRLIFTVMILAAAAVISALWLRAWLQLPDLGAVARYRPPEAALIYDSNGRVVDRMFTENRTVVPLEKMAENLPIAFISAEDGDFFRHPGIDLFSIARALFNNLQSGTRAQGGSTITQQVAKILLLSPEKTFVRKVREAVLATRIDRRFSKETILQIYLNEIYLGDGAWGVEAAAQTYFGKSSSQLTLAECALLAGLPQAPSRYAPSAHPQRARERQRYVLNRMAADGLITTDEARAAWRAPLRLKRRHRRSGDNGYYLDEVRRRARRLLGGPLQSSGARIYTWLDRNLQQRAVAEVNKATAAVVARGSAGGSELKERPEAAVVVLENRTGRVRALVGGRSFAVSPFNRATQGRRQAGSTFKPFGYAAALLAGWKPESQILDAPFAIAGADGGVWSPKNYADRYMGQVSLTRALTFSLNTATVRLMRRVGWQRTIAIARKAGIEVAMPHDLSLALGAVDISPLQLTAAWTIFADHGRYHPPSFIAKIVLPDGRVIRPKGTKPVRVLPADVAADMEKMLNSVVTAGTGRRAQVPGIRGGKTGTTDGRRDLWFVGFTDRFTAGVWIGCDHNQPLPGESGGRTAAPLWRGVMK